tara:strand:- start:1667 stop:2443 length:777 start_codon:yes stop_codon:yes gene_type:complete
MSATHRVNVTARNVDHWSWSIDGGADTMMPSGSTHVDITISAGSQNLSNVFSWFTHGVSSTAINHTNDDFVARDLNYTTLNKPWFKASDITPGDPTVTPTGPHTVKFHAVVFNGHPGYNTYYERNYTIGTNYSAFDNGIPFSGLVPNTPIKVNGVDTGLTGLSLFNSGGVSEEFTLDSGTISTPTQNGANGTISAGQAGMGSNYAMLTSPGLELPRSRFCAGEYNDTPDMYDDTQGTFTYFQIFQVMVEIKTLGLGPA